MVPFFAPSASRVPLSQGDFAIIQLQNRQFPSPQVSGAANLALKQIQQGIAWTVAAELDGQAGEFLLDTGASLTLLSADWLQRFNLQPQTLPPEAAEFAVAGSECQFPAVEHYQLSQLQLGTALVKDLHALQLPSTMIPANLDGVLGMDVLQQFDLLLHPGDRTVKLLPHNNAKIFPTGTKISLTPKKGVMLVSVNVNQQGPFLFLVDTGAESTFISPDLAKQIGLTNRNLSPIQIQGFLWTGASTVWHGCLP